MAKPYNPNAPKNYFGPGGVDITTSGNITTIVRRIPLVPRRSPMSCWVAAGKMVLGYPPSATPDMYIAKDYYKKRGDDVGGLDLLSDGAVQKFMSLNGLSLYPLSKWSIGGIEKIIRTGSALFWPAGIHAVAVAGIKLNKRNGNSSKLIIYDPAPTNVGQIYEEQWGNFLSNMIASRAMDIQENPETARIWQKQGWRGVGSFLLHK